jgi:protoheme IX farnesyltransferase
MKKVTPQNALRFGLALGVVATGLLLYFANFLSAFIGVFTIFFYVVIYTLYLKRRTPYNIVIGGAAGATAPLMGWAAATNHISMLAWILFLIIFMWTPPHFWALSLVIKEDYRDAKVPMLPVVFGDNRTRLEILFYSLLLIPLTFAPILIKVGGLTYLISGIVLGLIFLRLTYVLLKKKDNKSAYMLFGYSIIYLLLLFTFLMVGTTISHGIPLA